jgi:hypothetical protein
VRPGGSNNYWEGWCGGGGGGEVRRVCAWSDGGVQAVVGRWALAARSASMVFVLINGESAGERWDAAQVHEALLHSGGHSRSSLPAAIGSAISSAESKGGPCACCPSPFGSRLLQGAFL